MDEDPESTRYEPLPRWGHVSVVIGNKLYLWGGRIEDFSEEGKKELASIVEVFDFETELWEKKTTSGNPPSGLYNTAHTTIGQCLYVYGGWDGHLAYNSLHKLDVSTMTWTELKLAKESEIPMKMSGCGLVSYGKNKLVLFGGCGVPTEESQPQQSGTAKSGSSGTVSFTTVKSPVHSKGGASQEEETNQVKQVDGGGEAVTIQAEVHNQPEAHSQPESMPTSELTNQEGVLGLYDLAVSQLNSQVSNESGSQTTSQQAESKTEQEGSSQDASQSQEAAGEEKEKHESPTKEEKGEVPALQQNGELEEAPPQENGVNEAEAEGNGDVAQTPKQSQEDGSGADKTPTRSQTEEDIKVDLSTAVTSTPTKQNGVQLSPKEKEAESETRSRADVQPLQSQAKKEEGTGEESEDESASSDSESESDVMDRQWTNELKVFDIQKSTWMTPVVHGELPPPCVDFSFTCLDESRTLMYGGFQPESGTSSEAYVLNMETWHWTKLRSEEVSDGEEVAWPVGRDGHASCLLAGSPSPQVLISGGWDKDNKLIKDAWILNVNARIWKELTMPVVVGARFWHSVSCYQFSQRMKQLLFFGGCPGAPEELLSGGCWAKLAATVVVELGLMDPVLPVLGSSRFSMDDDFSTPPDWVVLDATDHAQLGLPNKRLKERVLLAEYRAIRAENIARDVLRKLERIDLHSISMPYDMADGRYSETTPLPIMHEEETVEVMKEKRPFWEISSSDVELTGTNIGRGKWSVVREAVYHGDKVAARCLYSRIVSEDNFKVFIECMDMAAKLRHTNLLPFIGAVLEGEPIIITELMPYNLKKVLEMKGQLPNYQIVGIALDVARALNFLHSAKPDPVIHGDLTSTSVLVEQGKGNSWRAKLSDFMTAKFFKQLIASGTDFERDLRSTSPGSPYVNSPKHPFFSGPGSTTSKGSKERRSRSSSIGSDTGRKTSVQMVTPPDILDPMNLTPKRDVYSYGLLLVEMCSGSTPQVISLQFLLESITWAEMNALIRQCLESSPETRPSMKEIVPKIAEMHKSLSIGYGPSRPAIKKTFV